VGAHDGRPIEEAECSIVVAVDTGRHGEPVDARKAEQDRVRPVEVEGRETEALHLLEDQGEAAGHVRRRHARALIQGMA
jgi:hypothetical protein